MRRGRSETRTEWVVVTGVDGCPGGWVVAMQDEAIGVFEVWVAPDFEAVLARCRGVVAIDIPIGLPESGPRACDREARRRLGPGATSRVFPAPFRAVLEARDYTEACEISKRVGGKALSRQAFGILPKIREVDRALQGSGREARRPRVFEVHPEVSFAAWSRSDRALPRKLGTEGASLRRALVEHDFPDADLERSAPRRALAKPDDVLDAFAALWSARRIRRGEAEAIPAHPTPDPTGLLPRIWF